jgi:hypothetical protein
VDTHLHSVDVRVERKQLTLVLKENLQGRFLRITEEVDGRHNSIVIPATGLELFRDTLNEVINRTKTLPPQQMTPLGWPLVNVNNVSSDATSPLPDPAVCRTHDRGLKDFSDCLVTNPSQCPYVTSFGGGFFCRHPDRKAFERPPRQTKSGPGISPGEIVRPRGEGLSPV